MTSARRAGRQGAHSLAVLRRSESGDQRIEMYTMVVEPIEYG